jgi:hypothetical protein
MEQECPVYDLVTPVKEKSSPFEADLCALITSLKRIVTVSGLLSYFYR